MPAPQKVASQAWGRRWLRPAPIALFAVFLVCFLPRLRRPVPDTYPADFRVYYSAALLVRQGQASGLYTGADTGVDPQKLIAGPQTPIFRAAQSQGLTFVGLYVYPPILADLLVPLTWTSLARATSLWYGINVFLLIASALLLGRLLRVRLWSGWSLLLLLSLLCFVPVLQCLTDGQITIFLLFLWIAGTLLYHAERPCWSAAVFALAAAIKLTPLIVLLPFLLWRRWRFVSTFLATLGGLGLAAVLLNTPHACAVYFGRVLPSMSGAIPYITNYSLPAATERIVTLVQTGSAAVNPDDFARSTILAGKLASGVILAAALLLLGVGRRHRRRSTEAEVVVLALLGLLAPVISPVSWFHAYSTAFIGFALLWKCCLDPETADPLLLVGTTVVSLLLGSAVLENLLQRMEDTRHPVLALSLQFAQLLLAAGLVLYQLWRMRQAEVAEDRGPAFSPGAAV